jgi:hypothetical protein
VLVEGEERWVLDELPAQLSEQAYMWQREHELDEDRTGSRNGSAQGGGLVQERSSSALLTGWGARGSGLQLRRTLQRDPEQSSSC